MFWIPLMMAGMSLMEGQKAQSDAKIARTTDESNTKIQNMLRTANNELAGAQGALARFQQSRQNQVHLKNSGAQLNAITTNIIRMQENATSGKVQRRIAAAEESGALAAQIGSAGIGGGTVQMLNATTKLRHDRVDQMAATTEKQQVGDMHLQRDQALDQMILGLSDVQIVDQINMMPVQSRNIQVPSSAEVFGNAAMTFMQSYAQLGGSFGGGAATPNLQGQAKPLYNNPAFVRNM